MKALKIVLLISIVFFGFPGLMEAMEKKSEEKKTIPIVFFNKKPVVCLKIMNGKIIKVWGGGSDLWEKRISVELLPRQEFCLLTKNSYKKFQEEKGVFSPDTMCDERINAEILNRLRPEIKLWQDVGLSSLAVMFVVKVSSKNWKNKRRSPFQRSLDKWVYVVPYLGNYKTGGITIYSSFFTQDQIEGLGDILQKLADGFDVLPQSVQLIKDCKRRVDRSSSIWDDLNKLQNIILNEKAMEKFEEIRGNYFK